MLLENKNAVIYGAGGSIAGAVARAFAREGATVFLTGHHKDSVEKTAEDIRKTGGNAEVAQLDAMDKKAIDDHLKEVVSKAGKVDTSFNAISLKDTQNIALVEMNVDDFVRPVNIAMTTQFLTATAAARVMMKQKSGVIISITATPGGVGYPMVGGFGPACCAMESFSRDLASELGPHGIRVVNIRSAGSPDSRPFVEAVEAVGEKAKQVMRQMANDTMLKKLPLMEDIANTAVFLASPMSAMITGVTIDVTAGTTSALSYKTETMSFVQKR